MTRFARAKGSKASNERVPEEATPWSQMKQQLLEKSKYIADSQSRQDAIDQRNANYKAFIEEKEQEENRKSHWAQFPIDNIQKTPVHSKMKKKKALSKVDENLDELSDNDETFVALKSKLDEVLEKSEASRISHNNSDSDAPPEELSSRVQVQASSPKIKKVKKKKISIPPNNDEEIKTKSKKRKNDNNTEKNVQSKKRKSGGNTENTSVDTKADQKVKKKPKGNIQPKKITKENLTELDIKKLEKKKQRRIKQIEKKKRVKAELKKQKEKEEQEKLVNGTTLSPEQGKMVIGKTVSAEILDNSNEAVPGQKLDLQSEDKKGRFEKSNTRAEQKKPKPRDNKERARKKPLLPTKMFINGKEVDVDYVDGFPVKKEDAIRLKKLRKEMISKGLPRSEINIALKLERRRAEKAFAREKKKVCFNCRKTGHNLSECPDLEKGQIAQTGTGICFKCGSTEHTHFECKVVRSQDFKYAQCFICNEQGHIARQCPDNARGLYPKGGSCKVCGDVTHLKKDCPKYQAQQQHLQSSLNVESIGDKPDDLDGAVCPAVDLERVKTLSEKFCAAAIFKLFAP